MMSTTASIKEEPEVECNFRRRRSAFLSDGRKLPDAEKRPAPSTRFLIVDEIPLETIGQPKRLLLSLLSIDVLQTSLVDGHLFLSLVLSHVSSMDKKSRKLIVTARITGTGNMYHSHICRKINRFMIIKPGHDCSVSTALLSIWRMLRFPLYFRKAIRCDVKLYLSIYKQGLISVVSSLRTVL